MRCGEETINGEITPITIQVVEEFHEDCPNLLKEIYEEGFLTDAPDILNKSYIDCLSVSSSVLSVKVGAHDKICNHIITN